MGTTKGKVKGECSAARSGENVQYTRVLLTQIIVLCRLDRNAIVQRTRSLERKRKRKEFIPEINAGFAHRT